MCKHPDTHNSLTCFSLLVIKLELPQAFKTLYLCVPITFSLQHVWNTPIVTRPLSRLNYRPSFIYYDVCVRERKAIGIESHLSSRSFCFCFCCSPSFTPLTPPSPYFCFCWYTFSTKKTVVLCKLLFGGYTGTCRFDMLLQETKKWRRMNGSPAHYTVIK